MGNRRDDRQIEVDRRKIVDYVRAQGVCRVQPWMRANDIEALVRLGSIRREVRREWDRQTGYAANMFGGAGVMQRRRAYLRI